MGMLTPAHAYAPCTAFHKFASLGATPEACYVSIKATCQSLYNVNSTQAHAKLMSRTEVTVQDAAVAVHLVEASMQCTEGVTNALHSQFADDPDADLQRDQQRIAMQCGKLQEIDLPRIGWD